MHSPTQTLIALDVGTVRIGIARANGIARIAQALTTLPNDNEFGQKLQQIIRDEQCNTLVVGLPRNLQGNETQQTTFVRQFVDSLKLEGDVTIHFQDEAVSSVAAEAYLKKTKKSYTKEDIDAQAARLILQDFLDNQA